VGVISFKHFKAASFDVAFFILIYCILNQITMAEIKGLEGLTDNDINRELERGAKFVFYQYTISILIMTFRRSSSVYFIKGGESTVTKGLGFSFITLLLGWWGIPWGPIYSIGSLFNNFTGGKDVTAQVVNSFKTPENTPEPR
jgi:hypothetical protein